MTKRRFNTTWDGKTVWVNDAGGCVGRFSKFGIDVHLTAEEQMESGKQCLHCTHTKPSEPDWLKFKDMMLSVYGTVVPEEARPTFL